MNKQNVTIFGQGTFRQSGKVLCALFMCVCVLLQGCKPEKKTLDGYEEGEEYSGGKNATTFDQSVNAFGNKISGLSTDEAIDFTVGNSFNRNNWVIAPSSTTDRDGLGPLFNARSCSGCHHEDGRGQAPEMGASTVSMVYRLSSGGVGPHGEQLGIPNFGGQLGNYSIPGVQTEGDVTIGYTEMDGTYNDGSTYSLRKPTYHFENAALAGASFSPRVAPSMFGMGLIDALSDQEIMKHADESDLDGDGISGKPNYVWDKLKGSMQLGKIGWKCNTAQLKLQVAAALVNDMGITSSVEPDETLDGTEVSMYGSLPNGGTPEINDTVFHQLFYYTSALAVPARRDAKNVDVLAGKKIFNTIGCGKCHISTLQTSTNMTVPQLNNQTIHPYSDFLLHDMGEALSDNRPDFGAAGTEWRTAPLWGMGLIPTVNGHHFLLHDGRARGIEEAILWHGGEGEKSKNEFKKLTKPERNQLIKFLSDI